MGFAATTMINREDYGMKWNEPMERGGFMVGKDVQITLEVEADLTAD
jgi:polyisoprenoid-binding protein YceI